MNQALRFHWMLPKGGEVRKIGTQTAKEAARYRLEATHPSSPAPKPDMKGWTYFAKTAEAAGIDSLLISFSRYEPEPILVAGALGQLTTKLRFIVAFRAGLLQPAAMVQQVNTLSGLIQGRFSLNVVAGSSIPEQQSYGDYLDHDSRYERAGEFMSICHALWKNEGKVDFEGKFYRITGGEISTPFQAPDRQSPEVFISGHSPASRSLATTHSSCWLRVIDTPAKITDQVAEMRAQGIEVCLRLGIICRPTRAEAIQVIDDILELTTETDHNIKLPPRKDSQMYREAAAAPKGAWLSDNIWAGFLPFFGPVWTTLVGTPEEIADAFLEYKRIGVTQFIISGWPEVDEVEIFGREILPLVRKAEIG
jgi:alkanesulfonate monooxygenase